VLPNWVSRSYNCLLFIRKNHNNSGSISARLKNKIIVKEGETIWLAWVFEDNPGVRYTDGWPGRAVSTEGWAYGMPSTFGSCSKSSYIYSIYADYIPTKAIGNTEVYATIFGNTDRRAMPFTMTEDGIMNSISIYHEGGSGDCLLAVYSDDSGSPDYRLAVTESTAINSTAGWQTIELKEPVFKSSSRSPRRTAKFFNYFHSC
jgi:hypothetical protein